MPTEETIGETFGVSRITVRQALDGLAQSGYIYKIQGKGSFVAEKNMELIREQHLKEVEAHLQAIVELAVRCGLSLEELQSMLALFYGEKD